MDRVIFHIDVNNAFLSWEAVHRLEQGISGPDLRTIACAVGGDIEKRHGVILAKSMEAKKYKVQTGEPITDALKKCPNLLIIPPTHSIYGKYSEAFMNILHKYSDKVEQVSVDEAFMDMTGMEKLFGAPLEAAARIQSEIYDSLGFTVNVGISSCKILAKMASDFEKPNKIHTLFLNEIKTKMWPLPVGDLFSVGKASAKKLNSMGIMTIGELAQTEPEILRSHLKKHGECIWRFANGLDESLVEPVPAENKGYGNSTTLPADVTESAEAKKILLSLAEKVGRRLREDDARIEVVSVGIRFYDLSNISHQMVLSSPTNITAEIHSAACRLFDEMWDGTPIRLLAVQTGRVSHGESNRQLSLFDNTDYEKLEKLDKAIDDIRKKYGSDAVCRASFVERI
ncbi:MAG: DNA polymerase IV [Lachnospiraceae bacterium]|nr:DNA polymerase IV [Lachnospiraceae bacterium]